MGVYTKKGTFQIIVKTINLSGKGDLLAQFEALKKKLAVEGLFDPQHKKKIPTHPKRIALITAKSGAAIWDFLNIYKRRALWYEILVIPTVVQGDMSAKSLVDSLRRVIKYHLNGNTIDAVVLTRGGGSLEDLFSFNDESLAWEIYNCPIPTISAVGHQVDFTISDFVADLRCETPSAAAEILTQNQQEIMNKLNHSKRHLESFSRYIRSRLREIMRKANPLSSVELLWKNLMTQKKRLERLKLSDRLEELTGFRDKQMELEDYIYRLNTVMNGKIKDYHSHLQNRAQLLEALGPMKVLKRGYTYTTGPTGKVISNLAAFKGISEGESINLHFHDGIGMVSKDRVKKSAN